MPAAETVLDLGHCFRRKHILEGTVLILAQPADLTHGAVMLPGALMSNARVALQATGRHSTDADSEAKTYK